MNDLIYISIASYNDPLLFFTLNEIIIKAKYPGRIRIGIVDQSLVDQLDEIKELHYSKQLRYVHIGLSYTQGACWARNLAFTLYNNEKYLLQIDSHTYFEKNWDVTLVKQHIDLLKISCKPILTQYPEAFEIEDGNPVLKRVYQKGYIYRQRPSAQYKLTDNKLSMGFSGYPVKTDIPLISCHISAGFFFCSGDFIMEIPYDPYLYFTGEEQNLTVRAYTHGWDIYHPITTPLFHKYKSMYRNKGLVHTDSGHQKDRNFSVYDLMKRSDKRLLDLLHGDGLKGIYGLGNVRTLNDYIKMSGIDYKNLTINDPVNDMVA